MSLAQRVAELEKGVRRLQRREPPLAAEFIDTAADPSDDLRVIARGWDEGEHAFGPVRWSPVGGALPQEGDEAVIVERDDGVWQVVAWWSDSQSTGVAQSALDALDARLDALEAAPPQARVYNDTSANNALTTATETTVLFNQERYDNGNLHSTSSTTGRLTAPSTGLYEFGAHVAFASNATGLRILKLRVTFAVGGTATVALEVRAALSGDDTYFNLVTEYHLTAGDYVEVRAQQNSGGNLNITAGGNYSPEFWMTRLGAAT